MRMKVLASRFLLFLAVLPSAALTVFWAAWFIPAAASMGWPDIAKGVSSIFAQNCLVILVILVILGSRNSLVEPFLGLDRMLRYHKPLAVIAIALLLVHVLLQFLRFYIMGGPGLVKAALLTMDIWEMVIGRFALILLIMASVAALLGKQFRLSFRLWKPVHLLVYAAVPMGIIHAWFRGSTIGESPRVQVVVVLIGAMTIALVMRLVEVLRGKRRAVCRVSRVVQETHDTKTVYLNALRGLNHLGHRRPGQFALLRIPRGRGLSEPHPFTISGEPTEKELRFTIKQAGRFTREIHAVKPGVEVRCEGPYGIFCAGAEERDSLALIAGGVGVTPFFSLLRHLLVNGKDIPTVLIWANKSRRDIFGQRELEGMTGKMPLCVVHVLSREKEDLGKPTSGNNVKFEKGRVTAELLGRFLREDQDFYLCG
ncbi:MAG TPA: hypothetical protein ENN79_05935, partial [Desulfobacteraceae bacterium]|nr:hypothetical protein [Desulfobacteraceae bacterium]